MTSRASTGMVGANYGDPGSAAVRTVVDEYYAPVEFDNLARANELQRRRSGIGQADYVNGSLARPR